MSKWLQLSVGLMLLTYLNAGQSRLAGKISDALSGRAIRNAQLCLTSESTSAQFKAVSDTKGRYEFKSVAEGLYTLVVFHPEYDTLRRTAIALKAGNTTLNLQLNPAQPFSKSASESRKALLSANRPMLYMHAESAAGTGGPAVRYAFSDEGLIPPFHTEDYDFINENRFMRTVDHPLSTFSIDVDKASYSNMRRFIQYSQMPPADAIRIEELINYFPYDYPEPAAEAPFAVFAEATECPWNPAHRLIQIGIQGKKLNLSEISPSNLVFLIDVSGSMNDPLKLPLVKTSLKLLLNELAPTDRVAIVVYASETGVILRSTPVSEKQTIIAAIDRLDASGSTAGGAGIQLAYDIATNNRITNGNNRIVLCTDGDFNVGVSSTAELVRMVQEKRRSGIYLTICGFGMGNYKDNRMEQISNAGNGNYYYIDSIQEARKVFVSEMRATLFTIARDVKIQVEFNPARVQAYRLIGYENRLLKKEDFNDDRIDAGELGAGHTVTALYEIIPAGIASEFLRGSDDLIYQQTALKPEAHHTNETMTFKLRYKAPDDTTSQLIVTTLQDNAQPFAHASENVRFAAAVAEFGMLLRNSDFKARASYSQVLEIARVASRFDPDNHREEFIRLVETVAMMQAAEGVK